MPEHKALSEHSGQLRPRMLGYGGWQPLFHNQRATADRYLKLERLQILKALPSDHNLKDRIADRTGRLLSQTDGWPETRHRELFTDQQLKDYKTTRRKSNGGSDYDDANAYLQRSTLVQMWNADNAREEQWAEYDAAQTSMEERAKRSGVPQDKFHDCETIERKRKRIVSPTYQKPARCKYTEDDEPDGFLEDEDDEDMEHLALEEGEIHEELNVVESIERQNEQLRAENLALKVALDRGLQRRNAVTPDDLPSPPASPPEPVDSHGGKTDSSDDDSMVAEPDDDAFLDDEELEVYKLRRSFSQDLVEEDEPARPVVKLPPVDSPSSSVDRDAAPTHFSPPQIPEDQPTYAEQFKEEPDNGLNSIKEEGSDQAKNQPLSDLTNAGAVKEEQKSPEA